MGIEALADLGFHRVREATAFDAERVGVRSWRTEAVIPAMGTRVAVTTVTSSRQLAEDAVESARAEMDRLVSVFDRHDAQSAVSTFNDAGRLDNPPAPLRSVLDTAREASRLTGGAFDVTVGPLVELLTAAAAAGREPSAGELADARAFVDSDYVIGDRCRLRVQRDGVRITLDGIAKGAIVDAMAEALTKAGVRHFLVDGGGDIRLRGRNPQGWAWSIGVRDPTSTAVREVVALRGGAVATSGGYARPLGPSATNHHIVNRDSGRSPATCQSVSVMAPTVRWADALATGMFVLGPRGALALADRIPKCACLVIDGQGSRTVSRRWPRMQPVPNESDGNDD
jgi:thiamine biosynthesis lipoprotein